MIASVQFRNFKALRNTSLRLLPFNLVIGPNGSGKTSLIQAMLRLCALSRLPLAEPPAARRSGGPEIIYQFTPPHEQVEARLGCVSDLYCDLLQARHPPGAAGVAAWAEVAAWLGRVRAYLFDHYAMAAPAATADSAELAGNAGNLAAVLAAWKLSAPAAFARVEAEFVRLMPEFAGLELLSAGEGQVQLALRIADEAEVITADNASQGSLYLLALLAVVCAQEPPAMVCIEEVDRGIHPRMFREIRDLLYRLSYPEATGETHAPAQVIVTTHSPFLLDLFKDHPEEVVIAQKEGRAARFERLSDRQDLAALLQEGSLGDLWFSGILGGVPPGA